MRYLRWYFTSLFLLIGVCFSRISFAHEATAVDGWTHLELGAGNYGADGHTKVSQAMTVLMKVMDVSDARNYIDDLDESGHGCYKPKDQYGVLFWTLDELVNRYGDRGIFHVNDLYEDYATFAAEKLKEYAIAKGYYSVIIEAIPGDYQSLDSAKILSKYGKVKYSSVHLKNPEVSFYHDKIDGDVFSASEKSRQETRMLLQHLANLSEEGLYLFILYHENFVPVEEKTTFIENGIFYHRTEKWESVPYIFPDGNVISSDIGRVFAILPTR
jgi:hypothetical protein